MKTFKVGQKFLIYGSEYILCMPNVSRDTVTIGLVDVNDGVRWNNSIEVKYFQGLEFTLTDAQTQKLFGSYVILNSMYN